jgi:hypothetical protein
MPVEVARRAATLRDRRAAGAGGRRRRPDRPARHSGQEAAPPRAVAAAAVLGGRTGRVAVWPRRPRRSFALALASVIGPGRRMGISAVWDVGASLPQQPSCVDINGSSLVGQPVGPWPVSCHKLGLLVRPCTGGRAACSPLGAVGVARRPVCVAARSWWPEQLRPRGPTAKPHDQGDERSKGRDGRGYAATATRPAADQQPAARQPPWAAAFHREMRGCGKYVLVELLKRASCSGLRGSKPPLLNCYAGGRKVPHVTYCCPGREIWEVAFAALRVR